ncbi:MAG: prolyl oligopeptidase family serine peptidase [Kiritimatiellae bacterium]|nr:prolyl oligopeptidase family serine peptidase [Kiritimatiellia bacterium]
MTTSTWNGYEMERTDPEPGVARLLVKPRADASLARDAEGRPRWYWKVHFWGAFPFVDLALLARGWHVAHATVDELYGGPECMRRMDSLYDEMVARGFSRHPVLCGMSRGGLDTANWAVHRAGAPGAIVLDNPVLDMRSWPLGAGRPASRSPWCLENAKRAWGFADDAAARAFAGNPVDAAPAPIAAARTPVLLVQALADTVVPPEENGLPFFERLRAAGGVCEKIEKPGADHHPHSLDPPDAILAFLDRHLP